MFLDDLGMGRFWEIWGLSWAIRGRLGGNSNVHKFQVVFDEKLDRKSIPKTLKDDLDQVDIC